MFMGCGRLCGRLGIVSRGMSISTYQGRAIELTIGYAFHTQWEERVMVVR